MALSRIITTDWGIDVPGAYLRVEVVALPTRDSIQFHLRSYAKDDGVPFFKEQVFSCDYLIDGDNPIKQAYEHLKTLPEFADAVDC